jgi:hypothetical protein
MKCGSHVGGKYSCIRVEVLATTEERWLGTYLEVNFYVMYVVDEIVYDRNQHVGSRANASDLVFEL